MTIYQGLHDDYLVYSDDTYQGIIRTIVDLAGTAGRETKVLELGCGSGAFSRFLAESPGVLLTGVDISPGLIETAAQSVRRPNCRFLCHEIDEDFLERIAVEEFDLVFCAAFLHHLRPAEMNGVLRVLDTHAREGSTMAFFEPNRHNPAIVLQYLFETKLNETQYDPDEFPLTPARLRSQLGRFKTETLRFLDVEYRNSAPVLTRKIRHGVAGRLAYALGMSAFRFAYPITKRSGLGDKYIRDYFLSVYSY